MLRCDLSQFGQRLLKDGVLSVNSSCLQKNVLKAVYPSADNGKSVSRVHRTRIPQTPAEAQPRSQQEERLKGDKFKEGKEMAGGEMDGKRDRK